jgi:membrane protein
MAQPKMGVHQLSSLLRLLNEHYGLKPSKSPGKIQAWLRTIDRVRRATPAGLIIRTFRNFQQHDGPHMAAGIAYYAFVALFPLMLGVITLASLFLDQGVVRQGLFDFAEAILPASIGLLEQTTNKIVHLRGALGILSIIAVFWIAAGVFGAISRAVNRAWGVGEAHSFFIAKARHLLMVPGVGLLVALSAAVTVGSEIVSRLDLTGLKLPAFMEILSSRAFAALAALALTFVMFALVYKFFPNTNVRWSAIWPGALLAAVFFEVGKIAFIYYVNSIAIYERLYGSLASVLILLVWLYYSALILIIGAEFASECARTCKAKPIEEV